jgi:glucose-6-phosphate isomerase
MVFIPHDYGHITINSSEKVIRMANRVCKDFSFLYEPVKQFEGGAYFLLENGFVRNPNYASVPEIKWLKPTSTEKFGLSKGEDMYELIENLQVLGFLKEPQTVANIFEAALC